MHGSRISMTISVIIPTLNEAQNLERLLDGLAREQCEIIVVDGGSADETARIAEAYDVQFM